jgi:hypothetical protein
MTYDEHYKIGIALDYPECCVKQFCDDITTVPTVKSGWVRGAVYRTRGDGTLSCHVPCTNCLKLGHAGGGLYVPPNNSDVDVLLQRRFKGVENVKELIV